MSQVHIIRGRKLSDQIGCIDISGELTGLTEHLLMDAYVQVCSGNTRLIILNFSELEYMNSGGIGLLVTLLIRANRQGQRLLASNLSDHYQHIFDLTRLNEAIGIYRTEAEAIAAVNVSLA